MRIEFLVEGEGENDSGKKSREHLRNWRHQQNYTRPAEMRSVHVMRMMETSECGEK